ncbi:MAG TPA: hypothetical protein VFL57_12395 [Bryobacteraceae bacterium]|nr:hypothetical protein [Bryobacteraceae bacterium]
MIRGRLTAVLIACLLAIPAAAAPQKSKLGLDKIPGKVMDALKARFPRPDIRKWTAEKEGGIVLYDIEFLQDGRKFEADIWEDGTIHNWEREIAIKDLPAAARKAVDTRYPAAAIKEVMAVTAVKDGRDALEGYEISLETAGRKAVEITVAPNGRLLEDSREKK